jgi:hypothetical protein
MMRKSKEINKRDFMQLLLEAEVADISSLNDHNKLTTDASKFSVDRKLTNDVGLRINILLLYDHF